MPKLNNRPPKYCKMNGQAVVYYHGKPHYLGRHGTPESKTAYARFIAEIQANPAFSPPKEEEHVLIRELTAAFLDHAKTNIDPISYGHCRIVILDFLVKLYGDNTPADDFKPSCLTLVRRGMIQSGRFCRKTINDHMLRTRKIRKPTKIFKVSNLANCILLTVIKRRTAEPLLVFLQKGKMQSFLLSEVQICLAICVVSKIG